MVGVAQLVRASGCGPEGRGFDPHHSPHIKAFARMPYFIAIFKQSLVTQEFVTSRQPKIFHISH